MRFSWVRMLNVDEPAAIDMLLAKVATTFASALEQNADYLRVALRFLAALVPVNVLNASAVMALLASIIQQAVTTSKHGESPSLWQPYVDFLVHVVLTAIPFGGADLIESSRNEVEALAAAAKTYADARPIKSLKSMRPFACSFKEGDALAECDFGACTFVATAVEAFKEYLEAENWQLETIPHVHGAFLSSLAAAEARDLPPMNIPSFSTLVPDNMNLEAIVAVQDKFPIRGELPLLEPQHTQGDRILLERLYVEDYILDTLTGFEGDRVECAKRLASGLPVPYAFEPLLCQTIFGQMLHFRSRFKPQMYGSLMIDLCKLQKTFPRAMSACVRRFCMLLIERLTRLSYWDKIQAVLPEEFCALLPPKPEVQPLEGTWAPQVVDKIRSKASAEELSDFLDEMERENGQLLLDIVSQSCSNSSLRGALSIERFVTMRFVTRTSSPAKSGCDCIHLRLMYSRKYFTN
ncbi:hypothetical protein H632_c90p1 [Helicosporidium sp. ATCC 50920]|nr:hypothetical protein H632_c90p1 [Helicosporidium sp. ATCC 50920]|eukprot:KDD76839.1 hypothetical protein H632_c90p1 [Helicosporidium sp. ATCC 50920]